MCGVFFGFSAGRRQQQLQRSIRRGTLLRIRKPVSYLQMLAVVIAGSLRAQQLTKLRRARR